LKFEFYFWINISFLFSSYYAQRWLLFLQELDECLTQDKPYNQTKFAAKVREKVDTVFCNSIKIYPTISKGRIAFIIQWNQLI